MEQKIKAAQNDGGLSRDGAVEEVVAEACEMVMGNSKAIERLAKEKPGLAKRIADWLHEFFSDIRKAFEGVEARHEEAKAMLDYMDELTNLWDDALVEAAENRGGRENTKLTDGESTMKYSRRSFSSQVDEILHKGTFSRTNSVYVGMTPKILGDIGLNVDLPMLTTQKHIRNAVLPKDTKRHQHGIKETQLKKIPEEISHPAILLDSFDKSRNTVIVVTGMVDQDKSPIIVTIKADGKGMYNNVEIFSNFVTSYYGRDGFEEFIKRAVKNDLILFIDKQKATALSAESSTSWLEQLKDYDFGTIIRKSNSVVNSKSNVKFSHRDTEGNELSQQQQEFFKDSKVRDERGNLKVMYHGTPNGTFTVFNDGTYFTENKEYADLYQNPGASMLSVKKTANAPKTYEVYLNIKKPFDIRDAEARDIYINDYIKGGNAVGINPYMSDAEYRKIKTVDWTEGEDLRDFLIDNGYDYDGLILDEGATGGYGDKVKSRGVSYVIFSADQVKNVDNKNPTSDPDIRFSRRDSAEGLTKEESRAQAAAYTRLKAENAELQRRVEYWKGQTQRTKQATVRQTAPTMKNKAAKQGSADVISDIFRKEQT